MPTPTPGVKLTLDKERTLRYGGGALVALEEKTGKNLLKGELGADLSFSELVTFVWAGLLHEDPALSVAQVADLIEPQRLAEIAGAMQQALKAAFPAAAEGREPGKAKART